jgi:hypothetical protein
MKPHNTLPIPIKQVKKTNSKERYFYIQDGYLYRFRGSNDTSITITLDLYDMEECSDCRSGECKSAWVTNLFCSDKLLEAVIQETLKEVATTKQVQSDQNPNLNEGS